MRSHLFLFYLVLVQPALVECGNIPGIATNSTLTLGFSAPWERGWPVGPYLGSAIILGIREVERRQLLPGYNIEFAMRDDYCEPRHGLQMIVDMWNSVEDLDAIIGPGCSVVCQPASLLAAAWGIPVVSFSCSGTSLSDKQTYPTFTRVEHTDISKSLVYDHIANMFQWKTIGIISTTEDLYRGISVAILKDMQSKGKTVILQLVESTMKGKEIDFEKFQTLRKHMEALKTKVRIVIINSYQADMRNILINAYDVGMLNGEYVFIGSEFALNNADDKQSYRPEMDEIIYEGLLAVGVKVPSGPTWDQFRQDIINTFQLPVFNHVKHLPASASIDEVDVYAGNLHDSVLSWAYGVNHTLEQGYDPDDGYRISANIFNTTFNGITGPVTIDEKGDRKPNLRVIIVQGRKPLLLMEWKSSLGIMKKVYKPRKPNDWSGILWPGNVTMVPRDTPLCGWNNELCNKGNSNAMTVNIVIVVSCIIITCVIGILIYIIRRQRLESNLKQIDEITIKWSDLVHNVSHRCTSASTLRSVISQDNEGKVAGKGLELSLYKGLLVVIKRLQDSPLNLQDRTVLSDLKSMQGLSHENINTFIGFCNEPPNVCFLMTYAPRGTLQDTLSNDDVNLSNDFKTSFLIDIARGMRYLHQSPVEYHGRLTSSHCVIDKRWTCKITGHGLNLIKENYIGNSKESQVNPFKLLWTSPEKLNDSNVLTVSALQKADVYSFAIICQEVFLKDVPFSANLPELEAAEIVKQVKKNDGEAYRPVLPKDSCPEGWAQLIAQSWDDNPEIRPSFGDILSRINVMHKNKKLDLVDNMIKRLESHTRDLEVRVSHRTGELAAEKAKMEILLSELLPCSVSAKLTAGVGVEPETFENVTIFFSDIVGFTRISAEATPMDVVRLLNNMYTMFDDISQEFDVYKVATIGDAYMVASGVPNRNEDHHATEICNLSIALLEASQGFIIPHMPQDHLVMRIGIHSGPCVAGVCGIKMPRYLLFGDTVDLAAKMESSGEPMRIHISDSTYSLVRGQSALTIERRGEMTIKGKGNIVTYWLTRSSEEVATKK